MYTRILPRILLIIALFNRLELSFSENFLPDYNEGPHFLSKLPNRLEFSNGTGAKLECRVGGSPSPTVVWTLLDGTAVSNVSGLRDIFTDGTLSFSPFRSEQFRPDIHTVGYRCSATNNIGTIISTDVHVKAVLNVEYDVHVYDEYAIRGQTAILKCHIPTFLKEYVTVASWIRDDTLKIVATSETDGKFWLSPYGSLYIKDISSSDQGSTYRCQTQHRLTSESKTSTTSGRLIVTDPRGTIPPRIINGVTSVSAEKGKNAFLPCVANGVPTPTISWIHRAKSGDKNVVSFGRIKKIAHGVLISDVQESDSGTYICNVNSSTWTTSREVTLQISAPIHVRVEPPKNTLEVGQRLYLKCTISSQPVNSVTWAKDGRVISNLDGRYKISNDATNVPTLELVAIKTDDKGIYQCFAQSDRNVGQGSAQVTLGDFLPEFKEAFEEDVKNPGESITISCLAIGNPLPKILWFLDSIAVKISGHVVIEEHADNKGGIKSTLRIQRTTKEDGGLYSCEAINRLGKRTHFARISIYGSLEARVVPPITAVANEDAYLSCPVFGYPIKKIEWKKRGLNLPSSLRQSVFQNGTLFIKQVQRTTDGGEYVCFASNTKGEKTRATLQLNVMVSPKILQFGFQDDLLREGMRARLQCVVSEGDTPLTLEWLKDGQPILSTAEQQGIVIRAIDEFSSILAIKMIHPKHNGVYTCMARNDAGTASHSAQLAVNVRPRIQPFAFQDENFAVKENIAVTCMLTEGDPPISFNWIKDGLPAESLSSVNVVSVKDFSSMLTISGASSTHAGNYTCRASNKAGTAEFTARLKVNVAPKIVPFSFGDHYFVGVLARVTCVVYQGDLPLTIRWLKDDRNVSISSDSIAIQTVDDFTSILTIDNIQSQHSGNYTCVALNAAAAASHTARLVVNVPPKIVPFTFQDDQLIAGGVVRVSCVVSRGDLPLTLTWMKDGRAIPTDLAVSTRNFDEYSSLLSINSLSWQHNGNYTCLASNAAATATFTAPLLVNVPPQWVKIPEQEVNAVLHQNVLLHCEAEGFPKPEIIWIKNEETIQSDENIQILPNNTLFISSVQEEHEGYYVCKASNGIGLGLDHIVHLKVYDPPIILEKSDTQVVRTGNNAALSCVAKGDAPLNVTWLMDGKLISSKVHGRFKVKDNLAAAGLTSELVILKVSKEDASVFACWAQNAFGEDKVDIKLLVQSPPDPPISLAVSDIGDQSVRVTWKPPFDGNSDILKYIVEYKRKGGVPKNKTVRGDHHVVIVSGLQPSETYWFRMFAENNLGQSAGTEPVESTIAGEAPSGAPRNVNVQALDSQTVKVSWEPPHKDTWNGDIRGYYVGYRRASSADPYDFQLLEVPAGYDKGLSFTIPDLQEFTKYAIAIQAFNDIGKGPLSSEILVMTNEDVPSKPPSDVKCSTQSSNKIGVTWRAPPADSVNGILRGHRVLYWPVDAWDGKRVGLVNSTLSSATIDVLDPFTNYSIQVVAYTLAGDGQPSKPVYCRTWEDVPGSPAEIRCVSASTESVAVYWLPPLNLNGHITHYTIYVEDPSNNRQTSHKVPGHLSHFKVQGLKRSLRYKLWVTASSVLGEGKASQPVFGGPTASFVAAKCITFGRTYKVVQGSKVTLPCPVVGEPKPEFFWLQNNKEFPVQDRLQTLPDNSLLVTQIQSTDAGNYTCQAKNDFGDDAVNHLVIVQVPPPPPSVSVIMATFNSVGLRWKLRANGDSPVLGYILRFKPEFGSWDSLELQPYQESHTLRNLRCGTTYEMTLAAINEVGVGEASEPLTVATDGGAPVAPPVSQLVEESTNHATLHLDSWVTNGCPILYFTIEYRSQRSADTGWNLVTKGVKPNQRMQIVPDLDPGTWYTLRMTAHSTAGTTVAEYDFSTLIDDKGGDFRVREVTKPLSKADFAVIGPISACGLVIVLCLVATCFWVRYRRRQQEAQSAKESMEASLPGPSNKSTPRHEPATRSTLTNLRRSAGGQADGADSDDDISPYAMVRLSDFQPGRISTSGLPSGSLPHPTAGWHQAQGVFAGHSFRHEPTAPPMSETYGAGGVYPTGMIVGTTGKPMLIPQNQAYAQPLKGHKKLPPTGSSLPNKVQPDAQSKPSETTFVFPSVPDGDYDPPPEFKWPFPKQQ